jgi:hypothetical protein
VLIMGFDFYGDQKWRKKNCRMLFRSIAERNGRIFCGSCCVTALIRKGNLVVSNAGDCHAVKSRGGVAEGQNCEIKDLWLKSCVNCMYHVSLPSV